MKVRKNLTLRIKKIYFDAIVSESKKYEYRACTDFYRRMIESDQYHYTTLTLHYQSLDRVTCDIVAIKKIEKPDHLHNDPFFPGSKVYRISLKNPRTWTKSA